MASQNPSLLHRAALDIAARGWPVFPLRPGAKRPALHGEEKCPRTGPCVAGHSTWEQRATADPDRIGRAWAHQPYNVGLATGPAGLVVIDLDTPKPGENGPPSQWAGAGVTDGLDVLAALCEQHGQPWPGETYSVRTGRGGLHLYFRAPEEKRLRGSAGRLGWKVDTRAAGGYVVAAGSTVAGQTYACLNDGPVAPLPTWLSELLTPPPAPPPLSPATVRARIGRRDRYAAAALAGELEKVATAAHGTQNVTLYNAAYALGRLVAAGTLAEDEVSAELQRAGVAVGLTPSRAAASIRDGIRRSARTAQGAVA
ncbi:bifunctional DNA primase/polymerase [Streptomyces xiamenensis]|uniref:bifunctional DNA primase/polymerase n=1 Tax=Streptomyces xiamenensis TaxID=408015 RepID=UPI0035D60C28